jgi:peptidyl-prolyl cis-trans isomerase SurA
MIVSLPQDNASLPASRFVGTPLVPAPPILVSSLAARLGVAAVCLFALSACTSFQKTTPLSPESEAILNDPNAKLPTVVAATAANSSIPVLVNDQPITAYDINQRYRLLRLGGGKTDQKGATEDLINETLEMLEAQRRGVTIADARVDGAFASIAQNVKMSPKQLSAALAAQGIQDTSLKKRLRAQMSWQVLVQQRTQQKATVSNEDLATAITAQGGNADASKITQMTLQQIIFVVPKGSAPGVYSQRKSEAEAFRQRFAGCDKSLEQAKTLRGVVVKDIGRRDSTDLVGPQGEAIAKTPAGKTAPPSQTDAGIEVVAVCSTRDIQSTAAVRSEVEDQLLLKQSADLGKDYLKELRDRAIIEYR